MISIKEKSKCSGCHACFSVCPQKCIQMKSDEEGFLYPVVDTQKCIECGVCEKVCPIISKPIKKNINESVVAYAAYTKNDEIRKNSSSGGIFSEFAVSVLNNGGIVFGAAFNENWQVVHTYIDDVSQLEKIQGSKYVQSTIGNAFVDVERFLKEDKTVLFTGTPCQINGLYSYLKKDYNNLITQDIVCHGVPSPKVWNKYVYHMTKIEEKELKKVSFRNKDDGWENFNMKLVYQSGEEYAKSHKQDSFMQAFLKNMCLRPSCYKCSFKGKERVSDITIADFWGVNKVLPECNDNKGISLAFINSKKGRQLFDNISNNILSQKIEDIDDAIRYNPAMMSSVRPHANRSVFMKKLDKSNFDVLLKKYLAPSYVKRLLNRIRISFK